VTVKDPTTPKARRYTTLRNTNVGKEAVIWNRYCD